MDDDNLTRVRADFDALKAKLKASADQLEPERYDAITARILEGDETTIRERIALRRGSYRVEQMMAAIERRLQVAEERERERT